MPTVRSVMTPLPRTIPSTTAVRDALGILEAEELRHLPVVDDDALVGIVSDRDLRAWRQALLDEANGDVTPLGAAALDAPVADLMSFEVYAVAPDADVRDAIALMLEERVSALPVVREQVVEGIVTSVDLLELLEDLLEDDRAPFTAADLMTRDLVTLNREDRLEAAVDAMLDHGIRHLPVVDQERHLVGLVTQRDVLAVGIATDAVDEEIALRQRRIADVMVAPESVAPETTIDEIARILRDREYGCVPVVDGGKLVGIVTEADFVEALARWPR